MIQIGAAKSTKDPEGYKITPDDRQSLKQTIDGVVVIDLGRFESGDVVSLSADFKAADWDLVKGYWMNRTKVAVTTPNGETISDCRIVVKDYAYLDKFKSKTKATIEIWRC